MSKKKSFKPSFDTKVKQVIDTECYCVYATNYGENKTSFEFYTPSKEYAQVKKEVILKISPEAKVDILEGRIVFL